MTVQGIEIDVRVWETTGEGTTLLDPTNPLPTSQARAEGHQEMATTVDDQTSVLEQDISTEVEVTPN